jgi:hypothetical protein
MKKKLQRIFFFVCCISTIGLLISCNSNNNKKKKKNAINKALSKQDNNDILLDSTALAPFFKANKISDSTQKDVLGFYEERGFQQAWINTDGLKQFL